MIRSMPVVLAALLCGAFGSTTVGGQAPMPAPNSAGASTATVQYVRVEGADYMFHVSASIKAGLTVFNLVNTGRDVHAMTLVSLPPGRTMKQFLDALNTSKKPPVWAPVLGETGTIKPGAEAFVTARLKPGRYVLACLLSAADGRTHTEVGMVQLVTAK